MKTLLLLITLFSLNACNLNLFTNFTSGTSARYQLELAKGHLDRLEYTEALAITTPLYAANPDFEDLRTVHASGYAGRAGFTFITALTTYQSAISAGVNIIGQMIANGSLFPTGTAITAAQVSDIDNAFSVLLSESSNAANRRDETNMFLAFVSLARIHLRGKIVGDLNNDGAVDGGFDACIAGNISDLAVDSILNSVVGFYESLEQTETSTISPFDVLLTAAFRVNLSQLGAGNLTVTTTTTYCQTAAASNECKDQRSMIKGTATLTGAEANTLLFRFASPGGGSC